MILDTSRYKFSNNQNTNRTHTMKWWLRHRDKVLNTHTVSELISAIIELSDDDCVENNIYNLWNDYINITKG